MLSIVAESFRYAWWCCLIVLAGFGAGLWPLTARWLRPGLMAAIAIPALIATAVAGPFLIYALFGRCDTEGGKIATYVWIILALLIAGILAFISGLGTARLWTKSVLMSLALLAVAGVAATVLFYMTFIYFAFSAEQCLL